MTWTGVRLSASTVRHEWRRTQHSVGYAGGGGRRLAVAAALGVVAAEGMLCVVAWRWANESTTSFLAPVLAGALLYLAGGLALMAVSPSATRLDATRATLESLPLSRPGIRLQLILPTVVTGLLITSLVAPPGIAVLLGFGMDAGTAARMVVLVLAIGISHAAVLSALVRVAMPTSGLASTHYALSVLGLVGILGLAIYSLIDAELLSNPAIGCLQLPRVLSGLADGTGIPVGESLLHLLVAAALICLGAVTNLRFGLNERGGRGHRWASRVARISQFTLETSRGLRNAALAGNLLVVVLIGSSLVAMCLTAPAEVSAQLVSPALACIVFLASVPARMVRGLDRLRAPKPVFAAMNPRRWIGLIYREHAVVFLLGCLPAVVLAALRLEQFEPFGLTMAVGVAYSSSLLLMWVLPLNMGEPSNQIAATFTLVLLQGVMLTPAALPEPLGPVLGVATLLLVMVAGLGVAWLVEPRRWVVN